MKVKLFTTVNVVLAILLVAGTVFASGALPGSGWWSAETVQNVGSATANVTISAYSSSSASVYSTTSSALNSGASSTYDPSSFPTMPTGFIGSAIVSADQPVAAIGYITNRQNGGFGVAGAKAAGYYRATSSPATSLYFPLAKHNWFGNTTLFYIQNAGSAAATFAATFNIDNGSVYTFTTPSVGPGQMAIISPADAGVPTGPSNNATRVNIGSLTVTSAQNLAGSYVEYIVGQTVGTAINTTRAFSPSDFDDKAFVPVVKEFWFGRFTGIQVQNVTAGPINLTVNYVGTGGACNGQSYQDTASNVPAGKSYTFVQYPGFTNLPNNCLATATITGTGNFVAIANEQHTTGSTPAGIVVAASPENSATSKVAAPKFVDRYNSGGVTFTSGLQIQNVGASAASSVVATFYCTGASTFTAITQPFAIPAGGATLIWRPGPGGWVGNPAFTGGNPFSASNVTCAVVVTGDKPLLAIVNEAPDTAGAIDDANYEGFNLTP